MQRNTATCQTWYFRLTVVAICPHERWTCIAKYKSWPSLKISSFKNWLARVLQHSDWYERVAQWDAFVVGNNLIRRRQSNQLWVWIVYIYTLFITFPPFSFNAACAVHHWGPSTFSFLTHRKETEIGLIATPRSSSYLNIRSSCAILWWPIFWVYYSHGFDNIEDPKAVVRQLWPGFSIIKRLKGRDGNSTELAR